MQCATFEWKENKYVETRDSWKHTIKGLQILLPKFPMKIPQGIKGTSDLPNKVMAIVEKKCFKKMKSNTRLLHNTAQNCIK